MGGRSLQEDLRVSVMAVVGGAGAGAGAGAGGLFEACVGACG